MAMTAARGILGAGGGCRGRGGEDGGLARLCRGRAERAARYNWDITPCSSAAVSCSSRGWDGEEGGGGEMGGGGSAVFDAGYHVDRHSEVEHWVHQGETITNR